MDEAEHSLKTHHLVGLAGLCVFFLAFHWGMGWVPLVDSTNLALHEAGHPLVGLVSERASVYGGTWFQLLFPIAFVFHFRRAVNATGVHASLIWLGENLLNIARYMADAQRQELPLVGGGDHDWTEIFSRWGVLHQDGKIAGLTATLGVAIMAWALYQAWRQWQQDREET